MSFSSVPHRRAPEQATIEAVNDAIQHGNEHLLRRLASNPSLPKDVMFEIVRHGNPKCLRELAANPSADIEVLTAIREADESNGYTRSRNRTLINIVKHPACNIKLIREIFDAGVGITTVLMGHCLEHTDLPADIIDEIADGRTDIVSSCNPRTYIYIPDKSDVKMLRKSIAAHPNTPPLLLAMLAGRPNPQVAGIAAANPSLPERSIVESVGEAARSYARCLYCELARDASLPKEAMFEIVRHGSMDCLEELATNPSADLEVLTAIREANKSAVDTLSYRAALSNIIQHPACTIDLVLDVFEAGVSVTRRAMTHALEYPDLPSHLIDEFSVTCLDLLKRYRVPKSHGQGMGKSAAIELGKLIAKHPNTPLPLLTVLAMDPVSRLAEPALNQIRQRRQGDPNLVAKPQPTGRGPTMGVAATNPSLPEQAIAEAVREAMLPGNEVLLDAFACNPSLPKRVMFEIVHHGNPETLTELAENPSADIDVLTAIREADKSGGYTPSRKHTLINIIKHPACTIGLIREVFGARVGITPSLMGHCMDNSDLPPDIIDKIAKRLHKLRASCTTPTTYPQTAAERELETLQESIAAHPNTPLPLLTALAQGPDPRLAGIAAANPSLPEQTIVEEVHEAMRCGNGVLLGAYASNPSLPKSLMFEILRYGNPKMLTVLAANPSADIDVLAAIREADKSGGYTRSRKHTLVNIVKHPACTIGLIRKVFGARVGITPSLMGHCMKNSDLPPDIIDKIAKRLHKLLAGGATPTTYPQTAPEHDLETLQESIAAHPNTPLPLLIVLAMDPNREIADAAVTQIQQRRRADPALFAQSRAAKRGLGM